MLLLVNIFMIAFTLLPIVVIIWMSFTPHAFFILPLGEFSLRWYEAALAHGGFRSAFFLSIRLAAVSASLAAVLAFFASYALTRPDFRFARRFDALFLSPLLIPHVILGIALLQFVNSIGLFNSFWPLVAAHIIVIAPFLIRILVAAMSEIPPELEWAALNLGATRTGVLFRIVLPACAPSLLAGFVFAFVISFDEIVVTIFMAGPSQQTLPIRMYGYLSDQFDPIVAAVSTLLIAFAAVIVIGLERMGALRIVVR